jgi:hypothetical protein
MAGSPRVSTLLTYKRRRPCWKSYHEWCEVLGRRDTRSN